MIFDINGNLLSENASSKENGAKSYDHWLNAPNMNGSKGYIKNYTLDSNGNIKAGNGHALSGFIPTETLMKIKISDISKINISTSKIFYFKSDKTYQTKKYLSEVIDEFGFVDGGKTSTYAVLDLVTTDYDISVTCEYAKPYNRNDNDWFHSYWNNTEYDKTDYSYTDMRHYGVLVDTDTHFPASKVRQPKPAFFPIPNKGDFDSYHLEIGLYPDLSDKKEYTFSIYREYFGISNLQINKTYWVRILGVTNEVETEIDFYSFDTEGLCRQITFVSNMRDIGGHKTEKWGEIVQGKIYRSAKLDGYSSGVANGLRGLGINCEIDLRLTSEIESGYVSPLDEYYNKSIGSFQSIAENVQVGIENYVAIFKYIVARLKEGKSVMYHCKGGADRTGVMSAILEGVLGASANTINLDYESTCNNTTLGTIRADLDDDGHWFSEGMLAIEQRQGETYADKWKSVLLQGGATEQEIEDFRCLMLTDY